MTRARVWITGAGGLIGNYLMQTAPGSAAFDLAPLTRAVVDLTDAAAVQETVARSRPDTILHCAAMSRTGLCKQEPAAAWKANVKAVRYLSESAAGAYFVFFSTDLVFDGR